MADHVSGRRRLGALKLRSPRRLAAPPFHLDPRLRGTLARRPAGLLLGLAGVALLTWLLYLVQERVIVLPNVGIPFVPLILAIAYGYGWRVGAVVAGAAFLASWYALIPPFWTFRVASASDATRLLFGGFLFATQVAWAEALRRARAANAATRLANDALQRRQAAAETMIAFGSHELRNPLGSVMGYTEMLRRRCDRLGIADERLRHYLAVLEGQARRMAVVIGQYLELSRLEANIFALHRRPCDLIAIVRETVEAMAVAAPTHRFALDVTAGRIEAVVDCDRLGQVLANLLANAVRHSPPGSPITVLVSRWEDQVQVRVRDQGAGIAPERLPHIFERGAGADDTDNRDSGLGLGLYLAREIVTRHGGAIWVESAGEGQGAAVIFRLPLDEPGAP